jgi:hypothetical protein
MHERKAEMARFADAFIALPGMVFYSVQNWYTTVFLRIWLMVIGFQI